MNRSPSFTDVMRAFARPASHDKFNDENHLAQPGMTLRDYFIAHAPKVPSWFRPEIGPAPVAPAKPTFDEEGNGQWNAYFNDYLDDSGITHPEVKAYVAARDAFGDATTAYRALAEREADLQWPGYWADEQLKRRDA